jgi:hypothetical protein
MAKLSPREVERLLGEQYAEVLARNAQTQAINQECKEVINTSLALMEHASRVSLTLRSWARRPPQPATAQATVQANAPTQA